MADLTSPATRLLPDSNEKGLDLVARYLSAGKVEAFRTWGSRSCRATATASGSGTSTARRT